LSVTAKIKAMENLKQQEQARETLEVIYEISRLLNCGLDRETLSILISLCENGVNPEALAAVVKELRREASALKISQEPEVSKMFTLPSDKT